MNTRPEPQKYLMYVTYFIAGVLGLGSLIGAINDTLDLITLRVSIIGTVVIALFFIGAQFYLKRFPWRTQAGRVTKLGVATAVYLFGMIALLWLPQILQLIPEKLAFPSEHEGETLIIIATFHRTEGVVDVDAHNEIGRAIQEKIDVLNLENVRVRIEPTVIQSTDRDLAFGLGNRYNASLIIWGSDTGIKLEVNFLNLRQPEQVYSAITISETEKTQLARPDAYAKFIFDELPNQLSFLSLYAIGHISWNEQDLEQALLLINQALGSLERNNDTIPAFDLEPIYFDLGWLYRATRQPNQAVENYTKAINLNPQASKAIHNRGVAFADLNQIDLAFSDFSKAIQLDPNLTMAYFNRGTLYFSALGDLQSALSDFETVIKLDPNFAWAYYNRALVYGELGKYNEAIDDYSVAISIEPEFVLAYNNRGLVFDLMNDLPSAIEDFEKAISINPEYAFAHNNLGMAHAKLEDDDLALLDFTKAIELDSEYAIAFFNRGRNVSIILGQPNR